MTYNLDLQWLKTTLNKADENSAISSSSAFFTAMEVIYLGRKSTLQKCEKKKVKISAFTERSSISVICKESPQTYVYEYAYANVNAES